MPYSSRYPDLALHLHFAAFEKRQPQEQEINPPLDQIEILYVYGLGEGRLARKLLTWLSENRLRQLVFFEDDLAALDHFGTRPGVQELIDHPQIHLRWVASPDQWDAILEACAAQFSCDKMDVVTLKEKNPRFRKIKLSLLRKSVLWHAVTSENISGHFLHQNIVPNLRRIPNCSYINTWKDAWKGKPVIICGAGPSLATIADQLLLMRDKALIIGCGSALSALSHLGIRPHLGMAIDPNAREFDCLKGCSYRDLPLLFSSRLYPKVFELFDGPWGYFRSGTGSLLESAIEEELGLKDPFLGYDLGREALSVTTMALSLAQAWGCNPIIFAGVDMAYAQDKHYSEGVPAAALLNKQEKSAAEQVVRRKGARGSVLTLIKWIMEKETIDAYAKSHPETVFLNASPGGLGFKNIPYRSLSEIGKTLESGDFDHKVQTLMAQTKTTLAPSQVDAAFTKIALSLKECLSLIQGLQQEEPSSGKAVLYHLELREQIAYQWVLGPALQALERIGKRSDPASLEKDKWKFLEQVTHSYLVEVSSASCDGGTSAAINSDGCAS